MGFDLFEGFALGPRDQEKREEPGPDTDNPIQSEPGGFATGQGELIHQNELTANRHRGDFGYVERRHKRRDPNRHARNDPGND
jgi:hypothetical protein